MTRDEIIRMAQEADVWVVGQEPYQTQLERFAALVAAAEREHNMQMQNILSDAAVKAEREACAKVCEGVWEGRKSLETGTAKECAAAIRARGQA